jgi:DNA-binding XRE family transcriptional regulator
MKLRIKELMTQRGIKQARLAETVELSPGYLSLIVSGHRDPSPAVLTKLATALGASVSDLFDDAGSNSNGFAEPSVEPIDMPRSEAAALCAALGVTAAHPAVSKIKTHAPAFSLSEGDCLLVDLKGKIADGKLVLATVSSDDGYEFATGLYRLQDPWLIPKDPAGTAIRVDDSGNVAILGCVMGATRTFAQ